MILSGFAVLAGETDAWSSNFSTSDGWTIITADRKLSAYYENTVVVTDGDPMILTYMPSEKR